MNYEELYRICSYITKNQIGMILELGTILTPRMIKVVVVLVRNQRGSNFYFGKKIMPNST